MQRSKSEVGASARLIFAAAKTKRAASLRLACESVVDLGVLRSAGVAEARPLAAGIAGRINACGMYVRFAWVGYVIAFRYARRGHRRSTRTIATRGALRRRSTTLGNALGLFSCVPKLHVFAHPAILQRHLWVRVSIGVA